MKATLTNGIVLEGNSAEIASFVALVSPPHPPPVEFGPVTYQTQTGINLTAAAPAPFVWTTGETDHG